MGQVELPDIVSLKVGEKLTLRFRGRGSAGYSWSYTVEGDPDVVSVTAEPPDMPIADSTRNLPPSTGSADELFTVLAIEPGSATIHFSQRRAWEPNRPSLSEHALQVFVQG